MENLGIGLTEIEESGQSVEPYPVGGVRVANSDKDLRPGTYIIRKGKKTTKIVK